MIIDKSVHNWLLKGMYDKTHIKHYGQFPIGIRFHLGIIDNHNEMKIALESDLGNRDIRFSIGSGIYMQHRAEELGLCEKDGCFYYRNLNPYKNYKKVNGVNLNELLKQSYLFNGIEAYAWNDVVWLSKSSFLTYSGRTDYLLSQTTSFQA